MIVSSPDSLSESDSLALRLLSLYEVVDVEEVKASLMAVWTVRRPGVDGTNSTSLTEAWPTWTPSLFLTMATGLVAHVSACGQVG